MRPSEGAALARQALAEGDSTLAGSITERLIAEFASYPPARLVRALLAEQANDTDAALDDLRAVTSAEPTNAEARAAQARLFQRRGDTDRARMAARQSVELIPGDPPVLESALEILNVEPASLETSAAVLARVHLNCGWPDLAERHARVAVSESPERVDVRLTLAEALWRLGRLSACEAECRVVADQAEECVRAAVMRAHILSERGRTAEGQELLDRIGRIDPEFREARELLGTLEVHRLVLPGMVEIDLPPELVRQSDGTVEEVAEPSPADGTHPAAPPGADPAPAEAQTIDGPEGQAETPGESAVQDQPSQPVDDFPESEVQRDAAGSVSVTGEEAAVSSGQLRLDKGAGEFDSPHLAKPTADDAVAMASDAAEEGVAPTDEPAAGAAFSTFDWARHLIEQSEWTEAERLLTDIVTANDPDVSRVDGLLLEAVAHLELRGSAWKLLGDHYMQTGRPQAAADAYLRAANVAGRSTE
ncbi:MAG: tetratricopeptide repeat protein [Chloroflexota bacterium]|nr:tetratricopeptide repeat protein [Chloroflexota bacterium]MDE2920798.1 tetratricopeptide repeat protein [Chloroflexota bacterium]